MKRDGMFEIQGKIAVVTGGASGIGLATANQLLDHGLKGITVADINEHIGKQAVEKLNATFGNGKAVFVKVNVASRKEVEDVFKTTVSTFQNLDIVVNCAGIVKDSVWEETIAVNLGGTINSTYFAFETYLPQFKSGTEGVIVNIASTQGLDVFSYVPIYSASKSGVIMFSRCYGSPEHFKRHQIRVMTVCPGYTDTPIHCESPGRLLSSEFTNMQAQQLSQTIIQPAEYVAKNIIDVIKEGQNGSVWVVEDNKTPYQVKFTHREESKM